MAKLITVKGKMADDRVALWEKDPDHPGGEAFIAGTETAEVAETAGVRAAIGDGKLERVENPEPKKPTADKKP